MKVGSIKLLSPQIFREVTFICVPKHSPSFAFLSLTVIKVHKEKGRCMLAAGKMTGKGLHLKRALLNFYDWRVDRKFHFH